MALTRVQKQKIIKDLKEKIARQKAIIFVDFTGLKIKDFFELRKKLKEARNELKVAKKTLIGIALKESGLEFGLKNLKGEIALIFGLKDEISPAKIIWQFSQKNPNLKILGGILKAQKFEFLDPEKIVELAKLENKEELLTKLITNISIPLSNFVNILQTNIKGLIYVLAKAKTIKS